MDYKDKFKELLKHKEKTLEINDVKVKVLPGVFDPDPLISYSGNIILDNLGDIDGKMVLDMGCGTGFLGLVASKRGAKKVLCVEMDSLAVKNALKNISLNGLEKNIKVVQSNLFENIKGTFDIILVNLPILGGLWDEGSKIKDILDEFLRDSKVFLSKNGKIYLSSAKFGKEEKLLEMIKESEYSFDLIQENKLGEVWQLYVLKLN